MHHTGSYIDAIIVPTLLPLSPYQQDRNGQN